MGYIIALIILICIIGAVAALIGELLKNALPVIIIVAVIIAIAIVISVVKKKKTASYSNRKNQLSNDNIYQTTDIAESNGVKTIQTRITITEHNPFSAYYSALEHSNMAKNDNERILYLEKALSVLPEFVAECMKRDGELPPGVPPRDTLPELYMRNGDWIKAQRTVNECFSAGALTKNEYIDIIEMIEARQAAAEGLLEFLNENPGFIQKNVYKEPALSAYNHNALVWVCRSYKLIRKEKSGNSNKLYCA